MADLDGAINGYRQDGRHDQRSRSLTGPFRCLLTAEGNSLRISIRHARNQAQDPRACAQHGFSGGTGGAANATRGGPLCGGWRKCPTDVSLRRLCFTHSPPVCGRTITRQRRSSPRPDREFVGMRSAEHHRRGLLVGLAAMAQRPAPSATTRRCAGSPSCGWRLYVTRTRLTGAWFRRSRIPASARSPGPHARSLAASTAEASWPSTGPAAAASRPS